MPDLLLYSAEPKPYDLRLRNPAGVYNLNDTAILITGRTQSFSNNGQKTKMMTRNSCIEFETNAQSLTILTSSGDPPNAFRLYLNEVDKGLLSPVGAAGLGNTQTVTISNLPGRGSWTNIRIMVTAGNEGFTSYLDTGTITLNSADSIIRFRNGQSSVNMQRELVGGTTGQALGSFNAPLASNQGLGDNATGNTSPYCVGNQTASWQLVAERRARTNKIGIIATSGGAEFSLYQNGVWKATSVLVEDPAGATLWRLMVFPVTFDINTFATYTIAVKGGPGLNPSYLDEIILFGDSFNVPAFDTVAVVRARSISTWGDSIEASQIAGSDQGRVWHLQLAQEFDGKDYNRGFSGNTIANVNSRFVADNADIASSEITDVFLGIGENDLATGQTQFTNAVRDFINNAFTRYTNLISLFVRGIQPPDGTYNQYLQDGIAASSHAAACIYIATPAGIDTVDGQHPTALGDTQMADAFDNGLSAFWSRTSTPSKLALTLTTVAPVVSISSNQLVTPSQTTLVITTQAPKVTVNNIVTPGKLSLTISVNAPTVSTPVVTTPTKITLILTRFAPAVLTPVVTTPAKRALTITATAPTVSTPVVVTPAKAALIITATAPVVLTPVTATPIKTLLSLSMKTPVVTVASSSVATPGAASFAITRYAPLVTVSGAATATPTKLTLIITMRAPAVFVSTNDFVGRGPTMRRNKLGRGLRY